MAKLDRFLTALTEYKAEALVLEEDALPAFRFLSGTKPVSKQVLDQANLLALLGELASPEAVDMYRHEGTASFQYSMGSSTYTGILEEEAGKLVATLWENSNEVAGDVSGVAEESAAADSAEIPEDLADGEGDAEGSVEAGAEAVAEADAVPGDEEEVYRSDESRMVKTVPESIPPERREALNALFHKMVNMGASDLHLGCGSVPYVRVDGGIRPLEGHEALDSDTLVQMLFSITSRRNREEFLRTHDTDFAYAIEGLSRFRCNLFYDRHGPGAVFRAVPNDVISADELGLPQVIKDLALMNKGLVLVTGPTGSGKSTTLAAILDLVNQQRDDHVITIEDPIEFVHANKRCLINQREVGVHTDSFKKALRAALREDPDVVLVGEMRDLETVEIAIETAETGHLVFGTLHTTTSASTVDRLIDQFPADRQAQIRTMLSESLRAVISQTLVRRKSGGRMAALEILLGLPAVSNLIREGKSFQLESVLQTSKNKGMQTLNDHLVEMVKGRLVEPIEAYLKAVDKTGLMESFSRNGVEFIKPEA